MFNALIIRRTLVAAALSLVPLAAAHAAEAQPTPPPAAALPLAIPSSVPTLPPVQSTQALPYPAYGTPAPGVNRGVAAPDIPPALTLQQAILVAFARSPVLASARADVTIANAPLDLARSAIFPNLSATASSSRNFRQPTGSAGGSTNTTTNGTGNGSGSSNGSVSTATTNNALGVTLRQLIFDGGRVAAQVRAARAQEYSVADIYERQLQTVANTVANTYYAALAASRQVQVQVASVNNALVQESLVAAQIRAGTTARADLATVQLQTAQARLALVRAQGVELSNQAAFVNALGVDANTFALPVDDVPANNLALVQPLVPIVGYDAAVTRAYALRPDLLAAQQNVTGLENSLRAARLGNFPTLNGTASQTVASTDSTGGNYRNNGSIGVALSIPIFDQGITHAQVVQAQGQLDRGRAQYDLARNGVQLNVKQALVTLISARAALDQANAEVASATSNLQSTQAQYRAGVTTLPLLLNAQTGLTTALSDQVTSVYTLRQAEQAFLFAEGANVGG